mmetsp:Transcript_62160/g.180237  ORF Transcript_62160/g.180237 Transcript_62160/m.180237 type:complete len:293 (-) Transcript_62160:7-885(-)
MEAYGDQLKRYAAENLGGFLGGAVSVFAGHPFDTIKVRLQAGRAEYAGAVDCLRSTLRKEGARTLFSGVLGPLITNGSINAVTFSTYQEVLRLLWAAPDTHAPLGSVFAAGVAAGLGQCILATPMELVRIKLQVQHRRAGVYRGNIDVIRQVCRAEGLAGMYRGNASMLLRDGPAFGVYFATFEAAKRSICPELKAGEAPPMWVEAAAGAATGAATWMAVMPADVISTRIQSLPEAEAADRQKRAILHVARQMYREGGARAFYSGLGTAVVRGLALNALVFPVYETTVRQFS